MLQSWLELRKILQHTTMLLSLQSENVIDTRNANAHWTYCNGTYQNNTLELACQQELYFIVCFDLL